MNTTQTVYAFLLKPNYPLPYRLNHTEKNADKIPKELFLQLTEKIKAQDVLHTLETSFDVPENHLSLGIEILDYAPEGELLDRSMKYFKGSERVLKKLRKQDLPYATETFRATELFYEIFPCFNEWHCKNY